MELIFINDASTDGTLDKLLQYEQQYPESVVVINFDENRRQGAARNVGLQYATGTYVGFVDADDWVELDMFERMVKAMEAYNCDFVECRWDFAKDEQNRQQPDRLGADGYMDLSDMRIREEFVGTKIALVMSCDKLLKREFLIEHEICYPEGLRHEDFYFSYLIFLYADSCYCLEDVLYHYYINPKSTVRQKGQAYHFDQMKVMTLFLDTCVERGLWVTYKDMVDWMFLEQYYVYMLWKVFEQFPAQAYDVYLEMKSNILEWVPGYKENPYRSWECNHFDDVMLKLLDYDLSREQFEEMRQRFLESIHPVDTQQF
jgi:glycosyltransferase involved in cell wall biosynthesis